MKELDLLNTYLDQAREVIGERTAAEVQYDDAVVASLDEVEEANREYPGEALKPKPDHWEGLAARYDYIRQHKEILRKMGVKE